MKKYLFFILIICFTLIGCNKSDVKGEFDVSGIITEVSQDTNAILVDDQEKGLIWITLPKDTNNTFDQGQSVAVWTNGQYRESYPLQATALHIELLTPSE